MRTCVGCGLPRPKRELVRVVRGPDLLVRLDTSGKASGRGVYVCPREECLQQALKRGRLVRALAKGLDSGDRERVRLSTEEGERLLAWVRQQAGDGGGGRQGPSQEVKA